MIRNPHTRAFPYVVLALIVGAAVWWALESGFLVAVIGVLAAAALVAFMLTELPTCDRCGTHFGLGYHHMGTAYIHEPSNWTVQCRPCIEATWAEWEQMWADYYASRL